MELHDIPGATPHSVCQELRALATLVPATEAIVELGVWLGRSLCYLGAGAKEGQGAKVIGIDAWDLPGQRKTYEESLRGLPGSGGFTDTSVRLKASRHVVACGLADSVTLQRGFSAAAGLSWRGPKIGLLFIDADHHEPAVLADFASWRPHLADDAVVAFDDYTAAFDGVISAVRHLVRSESIAEPKVLHGRLAVTRPL